MKKNFFLHYWPITAVMLTMVFSNFLLVTFAIFQPPNSDISKAVQATAATTPDPLQTGIIPNTGDSSDFMFFGLFSSWIFWTLVGMVLLFFLFLLMAQSDGKHQGPEP